MDKESKQHYVNFSSREELEDQLKKKYKIKVLPKQPNEPGFKGIPDSISISGGPQVSNGVIWVQPRERKKKPRRKD